MLPTDLTARGFRHAGLLYHKIPEWIQKLFSSKTIDKRTLDPQLHLILIFVIVHEIKVELLVVVAVTVAIIVQSCQKIIKYMNELTEAPETCTAPLTLMC